MTTDIGLWITQNLLGLNFWVCYLGLFFFSTFVCNELLFTFCGYLVFNGDLSLIPTIIACTLGDTLGSMLPYWLSLYGGRPLIDKYGKYFGCTPPKMKRAENWFQRYGDWAIFLSRFIPGLRTVISFPAGAAKMSQIRYFLFTVLGTIIWTAGLIFLGYIFGERWHIVFEWLDRFTWLAVGLGIIGVLWFIVRRFWLPRLKK